MVYTTFWENSSAKSSLNSRISYVFDEKCNVYYAIVLFENSSETYKIDESNKCLKLRGGYGNVAESGSIITDVRNDGEIMSYGLPPGAPSLGYFPLLARKLPNGVKIDYNYQFSGGSLRPLSVSNNLGYSIQLEYVGNTSPSQVNGNWYKVSAVKFYNFAVSTLPLQTALQTYLPNNITQISATGGEVWRVAGNYSCSTGSQDFK